MASEVKDEARREAMRRWRKRVFQIGFTLNVVGFSIAVYCYHQFLIYRSLANESAYGFPTFSSPFCQQVDQQPQYQYYCLSQLQSQVTAYETATIIAATVAAIGIVINLVGNVAILLQSEKPIKGIGSPTSTVGLVVHSGQAVFAIGLALWVIEYLLGVPTPLFAGALYVLLAGCVACAVLAEFVFRR